MRAAAAVMVMAGACWAADVRPLLNAIRQVETGGRRRADLAVGDGGMSIGPYQIQRAYWRDSGLTGRYEQVRDQAYAERVMVAYWRRYCPAALARGDWETLARTHNGGPAGHRKRATAKYWKRVERKMKGNRHG